MDSNSEVIEGSSGGPYMVEKIVGIYMGKDKKKYYQVKWVDSWEPEDNLSDACQGLIDEFWNGNTLDPLGTAVRKDELKQGLRVIKKENLLSRTAGTASSGPPCMQKTESNVETRINTVKSPQKLPTNVLTEVKTANPDPIKENLIEHKKATDIKRQDSGEDVNKSVNTSVNNLTKTISQTTTPSFIQAAIPSLIKEKTASTSVSSSSSSKKQLKFIDTDQLELVPIDLKPSSHKNNHSAIEKCTKSLVTTVLQPCSNESHFKGMHDSVSIPDESLVSSNQQSLEELPGYLDGNYVLYSSPPLISDDDNDSDYCPSVELHSSNAEETEADIAEQIQTEDENVIDIQSEEEEDDELEITVSIESPSTTKKRKLQGRKKSISTTGNKQKRQAPQITVANPLPASAINTVPFHPRCQLSHSNPDVSPQRNILHNIHVSPVHSINNSCNVTPSKRLRRNRTFPTVATDIQSKPTQHAIQQSPCRPKQQNSTIARRNLQSAQFINMQPCNSTSMVKQPPTVNTASVTSPINYILNERTCKLCTITFANLTLARQHLKSVHGSPAPATKETGTFVRCPVCKGFFRNNRDLKSHMLLHGDQTLHKCDVCSRAFKHKTALSQHILIHSDELPYCCEICNKRFRQQGHLIVHMGKHGQNNEGVYTCPHCLSDFHNQIDFSAHMRQHDAELAFCCNLCQERFKQKSDLLIHLDGHNEGRPFTCHICKKSFKTKTYLYGHMQMHKVRNNDQYLADSTTPSNIITTDISHQDVIIKKQASNGE